MNLNTPLRCDFTDFLSFFKNTLNNTLKKIVITQVHNCHFFCYLQVILVTDGSIGVAQKSLKNSLPNWDQRDPKVSEEQFPLPFPFPCKLHVVIVGNANEADVKHSLPSLQCTMIGRIIFFS
jgi:hypothetical protein